jgi:hypothetical protein
MGKQVKGWAPPEDAIDDSVATEPSWAPPTDAVEEPVKKKESKGLSGTDFVQQQRNQYAQPGQQDVEPSKTSSQKSTDSNDSSFVSALKSMGDAYNTPADPKDARPDPLVNAIKRGINLAEQAKIIGPFAGKPDAESLKKVADLQKEIPNLPGSESYTKFTQAKTFGDALSEFTKDPAKIIVELTGESLASMADYGAVRIGTGAALGAAMGAPIAGIGAGPGAAGGAIVGMADTSYGLEFTGKFLESLKEAGVDVNDPVSLEKAFSDDAVMDKARNAANKKAIPIALFDLVSGGVAGKIVGKPAKSIVGKIASGAAEFGVQAAMGAGGELAGQVVSGEDIQPGAILSEALGEVATTPIEAGLGIAQMKKQVVGNAVADTDITSIENIDQATDKVEQALNIEGNGLNVQPEPNAEGLSGTGGSNEQQGTQGEGTETTGSGLPATDEQSVNDQTDAGTENSRDKANQEIDALVASGDVERDGNKVKILTEKGGQEVKRIYEELENSNRTDNRTTGAGDQQGESKTPEGSSNAEFNPPKSVEQQGQDTENPEITDETPQQSTSKQQQEQQPPGMVEQAIPEQQAKPTTPPPVSGDQDIQGREESGKTKTLAIAQRIFDSDANAAIKRGVKEKGAAYVPKSITITDSEAKNLIELYGEDKSESLIRDTKNDITGDTRTALAARLYENYKGKADQSSDPATKQLYYDKAVDIALTSAEQLKEAGRQTNAAKIWKAITSNEDMTVLAIEKENQRQNMKAIESIAPEVRKSQEQFDAEVRKLITQKVKEGVETQLKRAKLITTEKKQQIASAFDKLKVKDVKGTANDITRVLGANVWNGSVEVIKQAVLTGADLANAIQQGIDYVKENFKGEWNEDEFKSVLEPVVGEMIPKEKINAQDIDPDKISTPKISGKKKKDFINQVVDAFNDNKLTEQKFDQLYAKQLGAREFSSEDRVEIRKLAKTIADVEAFEEQVKNDFTKENITKYKDVLEQAKRANADLQQYAQQPSNVWDTLISIMQGNLLTPLSLVTNIYSNTALQPLRFMSTGIGSIVDYSVSQLAKTGLLADSYKDTTIDLAELQKGYFKGYWDGGVEGLKQLKNPTTDDRSIRELSTQFSPTRAVARWSEKDRSTAQKINDAIEGTFGWPAEAFFRMLNLGDKPPRRAAELARAMELAKQKKLTGKDAEKFFMFPDEESAELIKQAGDDATFQQENDVTKGIQKVLNYVIEGIGKTPILGGPLKVLAKSQIPYVKTPWNIMVETLKYAAFPLTGGVGIYQIAKGNKRSGSVLVGQAVVGAMIYFVAKELFTKGLMSWDEPYDQKSGKQRERRQLQYDNIPPNALNVSAIQRGLLGEGWDIKDDDSWVDYTKLGPMGLLFDNYTNNYFTKIKEEGQMPDQSDFFADMLTTAPRVMSQALDQSFLKGTNSLLTAIKDGDGYEAQQWVIGTTGAVTAIVYPNTFATISKSSDQFIRDTSNPEFVEKLKNTYKQKFFIGDQLPPKVNLWGEKVTGNPEGRNKYAYYLWDPTKFKEVQTDNFKYKLYEAWKESKFDDDYLPSIPRREITFRKVKIKLTSQEYEKLATYIGDQRKSLASAYINSSGFEMKDRERVIKKLKHFYEEGAERGKKRFLMDMGWNVLTPNKLSQIAETR